MSRTTTRGSGLLPSGSRIPAPGSRVPIFSAVLVSLATALSVSATAQLTPTEQGLVHHIDQRVPAATALLRELVEINSGTHHHDGVRRVAERLVPELEALGFGVLLTSGETFDRAGHLVAKRPGKADRVAHVLLIGHLDTVFEPSSGFDGWEDLGDGRVRAPGITDMKGGLVVMLEALRALQHAGALDELELSVVLTGDEEAPGRPMDCSRYELIEAAKAADFAIGFEDGDGRAETAVVGRRGSSRWRLVVEAETAHSSQIHQSEVGAGAAYELARILDAFRRELADEELLTLSPGLVGAGSAVQIDAQATELGVRGKDNIIPSGAIATGDLRAASPDQLRHVKETMSAIVAGNLPGTRAQLSFDDGYPPMAAGPGNLALLALLDQASRDLGHGPVAAVDPRNAGAADVSLTAIHVRGAIDGLGLMGTGGHTREETATMSTLPSQAARAAVLLLRLARGGAEEVRDASSQR